MSKLSSVQLAAQVCLNHANMKEKKKAECFPFLTFLAFLTGLEQSHQQLLAHSWQAQSSQQQFLHCSPAHGSAPLWRGAGTAQPSCSLFCQSRSSTSCYLSLFGGLQTQFLPLQGYPISSLQSTLTTSALLF